MTTDEKYMRRCLQLARNGRQNAKPNPMVGAVIVSSDGRIIGEGYHVRCGMAHAEVNAFASVRREDEPLLKEANLYVSLEPCSHYGKTPPCADLIVEKGVKCVVVGCVDAFAVVVMGTGTWGMPGVWGNNYQILPEKFGSMNKKAYLCTRL